jgi:threonine/homoserine/homoserine lactone efflux protein
VLAQSAHRGAKAGLAAVLGVGAGALFHMTLAVFGLAALFAAFPRRSILSVISVRPIWCGSPGT